MEGRCAKHQFEASENVCCTCGNEFCSECLVYSFGPKKPPFCIACALAVAGVRTTAGNQPLKPKKEIKKENKARRKAAKASEKAGAARVEIEWSMSADPTEGLTEDDLRLPSGSVEEEPPPPPPPPTSPPPPPPVERPMPLAEPMDLAIPATDPGPFERPPVPTTSNPGDPPQMLLRQAEMPPVPAMAPSPPPPPPPPPPPAPTPSPVPRAVAHVETFGIDAPADSSEPPMLDPPTPLLPTALRPHSFDTPSMPDLPPPPPARASVAPELPVFDEPAALLPPLPPPPPPTPPAASTPAASAPVEFDDFGIVPPPPPPIDAPMPFEVATPAAPPPPPPPPPVSEHLLIAEPAPAPEPADELFGIDGLPPLMGGRESSPLPPAPPLPPASDELRQEAAPQVHADDLFLPLTTVADEPELAAFGLTDGAADAGNRPTIRVRDLLADPDEPVHKDEVSFFAPVTPEQLGDDRGPES